MAEILLVKLGGSLITDKRRPRTARAAEIERLAGEIAAGRQTCPALVLGHGSGSFGHVAAAKGRIQEGITTPEQLPEVSATQREARALHVRVTDALGAAGVPVFSIAPSSCIVAAGGRPRRVAVDALEATLSAGLVPVTHGDVVMDTARGASICSTEQALLAFARALRRRGHVIVTAYWFGDTDGVWDAAGERIDSIAAGDKGALAVAGGSAGTDVTGGMRHRLESTLALARMGIPSLILDGRRPGAVRDALRGRPRGGTRVVP